VAHEVHELARYARASGDALAALSGVAPSLQLLQAILYALDDPVGRPPCHRMPRPAGGSAAAHWHVCPRGRPQGRPLVRSLAKLARQNTAPGS